jgi:hypothetical protein
MLARPPKALLLHEAIRRALESIACMSLLLTLPLRPMLLCDSWPVLQPAGAMFIEDGLTRVPTLSRTLMTARGACCYATVGRFANCICVATMAEIPHYWHAALLCLSVLHLINCVFSFTMPACLCRSLARLPWACRTIHHGDCRQAVSWSGPAQH